MTARAVTIGGYLLLAVAALVLASYGRRGRRLSPLRSVVDAMVARRATAIVLVLAWAWVGWHFLAR